MKPMPDVFSLIVLIITLVTPQLSYAQSTSSPLLNQAIELAQKRLEQIKIEYSKTPLVNEENAKRLVQLREIEINAETFLANSKAYSELFQSFLTALPNFYAIKSNANQVWSDALKTKLSPTDPCKPLETGCFITISLGDVVAYFKELEIIYASYKGNPYYLNQAVELRSSTQYKLTPQEGIAALNVWNEHLKRSNPNKLPAIDWDSKKGKLIYRSENALDLVVQLPIDSHPTLKLSADQKVSASAMADPKRITVKLNQSQWDSLESNTDQTLWQIINDLNFTYFDKPLHNQNYSEPIRIIYEVNEIKINVLSDLKKLGPYTDIGLDSKKSIPLGQYVPKQFESLTLHNPKKDFSLTWYKIDATTYDRRKVTNRGPRSITFTHDFLITQLFKTNDAKVIANKFELRTYLEDNPNFVQIIRFLNTLSIKHGFKPCFNDSDKMINKNFYDCTGYRLPSQFEIELAANRFSQNIDNPHIQKIAEQIVGSSYIGTFEIIQKYKNIKYKNNRTEYDLERSFTDPNRGFDEIMSTYDSARIVNISKSLSTGLWEISNTDDSRYFNFNIVRSLPIK